VDVFFVISGYLITSIIHRQMVQGTFSLKEFYLRRIRRLFPALAAMLGGTLLAGYFLLHLPAFQSLARQAISVLLLASNVTLRALAYWQKRVGSPDRLHVHEPTRATRGRRQFESALLAALGGANRTSPAPIPTRRCGLRTATARPPPPGAPERGPLR
jgi:hypothetical protein